MNHPVYAIHVYCFDCISPMESVRLVAHSIKTSSDKPLNNIHMGYRTDARAQEKKRFVMHIAYVILLSNDIFNAVGALQFVCSCMRRATFLLNHMDITGRRVYMFTTEDSRAQ